MAFGGQPFQFGMNIDSCLTRLACITLLALPSRQRRMPDAQILRDSRRVRPIVSASRTASRRNSGVGRFPFPIEHLLVPQLLLSTFSGQVQSGAAFLQPDTRVGWANRDSFAFA